MSNPPWLHDAILVVRYLSHRPHLLCLSTLRHRQRDLRADTRRQLSGLGLSILLTIANRGYDHLLLVDYAIS